MGINGPACKLCKLFQLSQPCQLFQPCKLSQRSQPCKLCQFCQPPIAPLHPQNLKIIENHKKLNKIIKKHQNNYFKAM